MKQYIFAVIVLGMAAFAFSDESLVGGTSRIS